MTNPHSYFLLGSLLILAFSGSWHCAVMCGPIALGLSQRGSIVFYHLGRAVSYISAGVLFGYLGHSLFQINSLTGKMIAAIFLSSFFVLPLVPSLNLDRYGHLFFGKIARHRPGLFIFGMASVLLPCGWLWTFLAAAAASGNAKTGAVILTVLWLSSLPALAALPQYFQKSLKGASRRRLNIVQRVLSCAGVYAIWSHFFF